VPAFFDGAMVGSSVGPSVGDSDGRLEVTTRTEGLIVGSSEGLALTGRAVGLNVGESLGCEEKDGMKVCATGPCWLG
jgi:hypothetical protein